MINGIMAYSIFYLISYHDIVSHWQVDDADKALKMEWACTVRFISDPGTVVKFTLSGMAKAARRVVPSRFQRPHPVWIRSKAG